MSPIEQAKALVADLEASLCPPDGDLVDWLRQEYQLVRVLPDGSIACLDRLVYTTALFLGADRWGYEHRFCFDDHALARRRFDELQSADDDPQGYIARR